MASNGGERSRRARIGLLVILCAASISAGWVGWIDPRRTEIEDAKQRLDDLDRSEHRMRLAAAALPAMQRELIALEQASREAKQAVVSDGGRLEVLSRVQDLARESGLTVSSFKIRPIVPQDGYVEHPTEFMLLGSYHDLGRFLASVSSLPELVALTELHITAQGNPSAGGSVSIRCVATSYTIPPEGPALDDPV
jgi:type IV pilus assembly protein PilO